MRKKEFKKYIGKFIDMAKEKGFLTYDEVNDMLSESIMSANEVDEMFDTLEKKNVKVVDTAKPILEKDLDKDLLDSEIKSEPIETQKQEKYLPLDDPVKMYLKQMGSIPLLSREKEIELAKKIEEAEDKFLEAILNTRFARRDILQIINQILDKKLNIEDIIKDETIPRPTFMRRIGARIEIFTQQS